MSNCTVCGKPAATGKVVCGECWTATTNRLAAYEATGLAPEEITAAADRRHECKIDCLLEKYNKQSALLAGKDKEIDRLKEKLNAAMRDIPHLCRTCGNGFYGDNGFDCDQAHYKSGCRDCLSWEWRGRRDGGREERYEAD